MGQDKSKPFSKQLEEYRVVEQFPENNQTHLVHIQTQKEYLLRELTFTDQNSFKKCEDDHKKRQPIQEDHLTHLHKIQGKEIDQLCTNIFKVYALWEYPYRFLSQEIRERQNQRRKFEERELWSILASCIMAMSVLQKNKIRHESLTTRTILLDSDGLLKVVDPLALGSRSNLDVVYENRQAKGIYLSPEQCQALESKGAYSNPFKNDVWALAIILLECGLFEAQDDLYKDDLQRIDYSELNRRVQEFGKLYGEDLQIVVDLMLKRDSKDRPDWIDLEKFKHKQAPSHEQVQYIPSSFSGRASTSAQKVSSYQPSLQSPPPYTHINQPVPQPHYVPITQAHPPMHTPPVQFVSHNTGTLNNQYSPNQGYRFQSMPVGNPQPLNFNEVKASTGNSYYQPQGRPAVSNDYSGLYTNPALLDGIRTTYQPIVSQNTYQVSPTKHYAPPKEVTPSVNFGSLQTSYNYTPNYTNTYETTPVNPSPKQPAPNTTQIVTSSATYLHNVDPEPKEKQEKNEEELEYVVETFKQGSRYEGYKLHDMRHGEGKFYYQDGGLYDGNWRCNKMDGQGALYYQSGKIAYEGNWRIDQFHGHGKLYNENPIQLDCEFDYRNFDEIDEYWEYYEGEFVQDFKKGHGKLKISNGEYFQGTFENDMVQGTGTYHRLDGTVIKGTWRANQLSHS